MGHSDHASTEPLVQHTLRGGSSMAGPWRMRHGAGVRSIERVECCFPDSFSPLFLGQADSGAGALTSPSLALPAFSGCVGAGGFHSVATLIGLSELPERHAGPRMSRYVVRRTSDAGNARHGMAGPSTSSRRMRILGARPPPLPHHVAQSHMGTEARCTPQPCRSFLRCAPEGLCLLLTILIAVV